MIKRKNRDRKREGEKEKYDTTERERERARALSALGSVFTIAMNLYVHKLKDTRLQGTSGKWPELLDFVLPFFFFLFFWNTRGATCECLEAFLEAEIMI